MCLSVFAKPRKGRPWLGIGSNYHTKRKVLSRSVTIPFTSLPLCYSTFSSFNALLWPTQWKCFSNLLIFRILLHYGLWNCNILISLCIILWTFSFETASRCVYERSGGCLYKGGMAGGLAFAAITVVGSGWGRLSALRNKFHTNSLMCWHPSWLSVGQLCFVSFTRRFKGSA